MCLYVKDNKIQIAKKPITVWKCVYDDRTPPLYRNSGIVYKKGQIVRALNGRRKPLTRLRTIDGFVEAGIHTFTKKQDCLEYCDPGQIAIKCVVPRGTQYVQGRERIVSLKVRVIT